MRHGRHLTATRWRDDLIVASDQSLPRRDVFPVSLADGTQTEATVLGRDDASNIALLRLATAPTLEAPALGTARTGALALAIGTRKDGAATACLGVVNQVGPAWTSQAGGRIDAYIKVDLGMTASEEGGPVLDAEGGVIGISTFGPRGHIIVIPHATIERIIPQLLEGGQVARGWIGAALQPIAVPNVDDDLPSRGFMIMSVVENGPAAAAGLTPGDIVVTAGGQAVGRLHGLSSHIAGRIGQTLDLGIVRPLKAKGERVETVTLTVTERPAE
jgi:S1-C subfamily serine protease